MAFAGSVSLPDRVGPLFAEVQAPPSPPHGGSSVPQQARAREHQPDTLSTGHPGPGLGSTSHPQGPRSAPWPP